MKAAFYSKYGSPNVISIKEINKPIPKSNEVLVKVFASSLNASDFEFLKGKPLYTRMWGLTKPKNNILGSDISGIIEEVGINSQKFKVAQKVFGDIFEHLGGFAEYVCVPENLLTLIPDYLSFEQAASLPQASIIALQGLQPFDSLKNKNVLINGAGGGAGSLAIQIAKNYNAIVTGVDNTSKVEFMKNLGADFTIDFTKEDFTNNGRQYDLILDFTASHSIISYYKSLAPNGSYVMVGGTIPRLLQTLIFGSLISAFTKKRMRILAVKPNKGIDDVLNLISKGVLVPKINKVFNLNEIVDAFKYFDSGNSTGKIIIKNY